MISASQIKPNTPVVCSQDGQFGIVDHMEGKDTIKLKKDKNGQHHYIPLSWVTSVDEKVHVDRPGAQAMKDWSTSPALSDKVSQERATNEGMRTPPRDNLNTKTSGRDSKEMRS